MPCARAARTTLAAAPGSGRRPGAGGYVPGLRRLGPVDHTGDGVPAEWAAVFTGQQQWMLHGDVPSPVLIDEGGQLGVQGK